MAKPAEAAPWKSEPIAPAMAGCLKALSTGEARPDQQKRAIKWIVEVLCETYGMSYRPDSPRDTDFAEGKRFVGNQIVRHIKFSGGTK